MIWDDERQTFRVVINHELQYSIWPSNKPNPDGWTDVGMSGNKSECLDYIRTVWTDMRPLSIRERALEDEGLQKSHTAGRK